MYLASRLAFMVYLLASAGISAQTSMNFHHGKTMLQYEISRPALELRGDVKQRFSTGAHFITAHVRMSPSLAIVGELPISRLALSSRESQVNASETNIGNPYIGAQIGTLAKLLTIEFGVYIPLISEVEASHVVGLTADLTERYAAFSPNVLPVKVQLNGRLKNSEGQFFHLRTGPVFMLNTSESGEPIIGGKSELQVVTSAFSGIDTEKIDFGLGYSSRWFPTQSVDFRGNIFFHVFYFRAAIKAAGFEAFISLKKPVNSSYSSSVTNIISLGLRYFPFKS